MTMENHKGAVDITAGMAGLFLPGKILAKTKSRRKSRHETSKASA
jgi:hypothetical protein